MSYGKAVRDELRVPTRELRHAIPQVYAGYKELHDSALAPGVLDAKTKELIALAIAVSKEWGAWETLLQDPDDGRY